MITLFSARCSSLLAQNAHVTKALCNKRAHPATIQQRFDFAEDAACVKIFDKQDLRWFFSQWLDRVGCPELRVRRSTDAEPAGLVIEQTQKGDPYTFWLQLRWTGADGTVHNKEVRVRERTTKVAIAGSIDDLRLDPDVQLLFRQK